VVARDANHVWARPLVESISKLSTVTETRIGNHEPLRQTPSECLIQKVDPDLPFASENYVVGNTSTPTPSYV